MCVCVLRVRIFSVQRYEKKLKMQRVKCGYGTGLLAAISKSRLLRLVVYVAKHAYLLLVDEWEVFNEIRVVSELAIDFTIFRLYVASFREYHVY